MTGQENFPFNTGDLMDRLGCICKENK